jgi:hypothetical protein
MSDPEGNYRADSNRDWRGGHEKEILQAAQQAHQAEEARPTFLHRLVLRLRRLSR